MKKIDQFIAKTTKYLFVNRWRFAFLVPLFLFIDMISKMPYLGLLLTFENRLILYWILVVLILKIGYKGTSIIAFSLTLLAVFSSIRERTVLAEQLGIIIVVLVFVAYVQSRIKTDL